MALTNPSRLITAQQLQYFESKLAAKYQAKSIEVSGIEAVTVEGALAELASAITSLPSAIIPKGTKAFAELAPSTDLVAGKIGWMYNISDSFTTTSDFAEGAGHVIPAGANIYIANTGTAADPVYKYDIFAGMVDLSNFKTLQTAVTDPTASGNALSFIDSISQNENGEITVTKKTVSSASSSGAGLMSAADFDKLAALPTAAALETSLGGKADKVSGAQSGNFAGLDSNGNLTDSGSKASDFKTVQTAKTDPSVGSTPGLSFIATFAQDANGEVTVTKENVQAASASQAGVMSAAHYSKLEAIAYAESTDIDEIFA